MRGSLPEHGVGVGWRRELAGALFNDRARVELVEVVAETCFVSPAARREARAINELWPVVPHGVKLSLGSADGIDRDNARRLGALARELGAPCVTEHVAFVRADGTEIGHLTQLPRTRAAVECVGRNVETARRCLGDLRLVLENVAWTVRWPDDAMTEPEFYTAVVERTGCDLLLDVSNLYANALNEGRDPFAVLREFPLERVVMAHLAGGRRLSPEFYLDSHADAVPDTAFELLNELMRLRGAVPVILERDSDFPPWPMLARELDRAREIAKRHSPAIWAAQTLRRSLDLSQSSAIVALGATQGALARAITRRQGEAIDSATGFDRESIERTRVILQRKRVDDAMPLLTRLQAHRDVIDRLAVAAIECVQRPPRHTALTDAWTIAMAVVDHPTAGPAARFDLLVLRARTHPAVINEITVRAPRRAPFVGRLKLPSGETVWAFKTVGESAGVKIRRSVSAHAKR